MFALRRLPRSLATAVRHNSTTAPTAPPLLTTLRIDLKTAMRSKNQVQLSVLRSLLAEITNAQKTANPPNDDLAILQIINKTRGRSSSSIAEAKVAGRQDLVEKEEAQLKLLDEYADLVQTVGKEEIRAAVEKVVAKLQSEGARVVMGDVMKGAIEELQGRPVVKAEVAVIVKEVLGAAK